MTEQAREWLPVDAADRQAVRGPLAAAVIDWSAAWFGDADLRASRFTAAATAASRDSDSWRIWPSTVAVQCSGRALARLLDRALDADVERLAASDIDRRLIGEFERRLLGDLVRRVEQALGLDGGALGEVADKDPLRPFGGLLIEVANSHDDRLLSLAVPLKVLLPTIKRSLPKSERPILKLASLRGALADTSVPVQAILGSAQITLPDLQGLAPGDVLVLDTQLDDTAALSIAGSGHVFARAKLTPTGEDMTLTLQA